MNNIGFGIFCFGEEYYYKGTIEKINNILNEGYHCYILTENTEYFTKKYVTTFVHVIEYNRSIKSYSDKMLLPKHILKNHDIGILIDADCDVKDYTFLNDLKKHEFKQGISYTNTLLDHNANREYIKDLITPNSKEWGHYIKYVDTLNVDYLEKQTIWEYFMVFNKVGFNLKSFYSNYEKLQIAKEYCDLKSHKEVIGFGEGVSIQIAGTLSNTPVNQDEDLLTLIKDKIYSISRKFVRPEFWLKSTE
jgi:hypothetical protein